MEPSIFGDSLFYNILVVVMYVLAELYIWTVVLWPLAIPFWLVMFSLFVRWLWRDRTPVTPPERSQPAFLEF